jgi:Ca-activated chloride channel family protein
MRLLSSLAIVCTLALVGFAAQAPRTATRVVTGDVADHTGAPVAGATVRLSRPDFTTRTTVTNQHGRFRFDSVPAAVYEIEVTHPAFAKLVRPVNVGSAESATITVRLTLQPLSSGPPAMPDAAPAEYPQAASARVEENVSRSADAKMAGALPRNAAPSSAPPPPPAAARPASAADFRRRYMPMPGNTESYDRIEDNNFRSTIEDPLSTFSIDVDTASYANVRRFLNGGTMPPTDAVRVEEMINYFRYDYPKSNGSAPFSVTTELTTAPWNSQHRLALIGLQARQLDDDRTLRRNLVFLIDVSGSMEPEDKLPLVRKSMRMLVDTLTASDRIAIVVYAGASGLVLPATPGNHKERIHEAIARLNAGGSTNGGAGISLAYKVAREQFIDGGINRVILATDGDFNVGITNQGELVRLIEHQRQAGVFLSVLGVGTGNLKDATMEKLADKGNGNYSYLDSLHEARKVLVAEAGGTLVTVAKDVKIQVEFNPAHVGAYRLIGYENRLLRNEDFNNDRKDAGEIGAGHTVTALYELIPPGVSTPSRVDPLRYQQTARPAGPAVPTEFSKELMTVKLRYKEPEGDTSKLLTFPVLNRVTERSDNAGFAAAVAEFGMLLRQSEHRGDATYREAAALARRHRGPDESGYRAEFIRLIELAEALTRQTRRD